MQMIEDNKKKTAVNDHGWHVHQQQIAQIDVTVICNPEHKNDKKTLQECF